MSMKTATQERVRNNNKRNIDHFTQQTFYFNEMVVL